MNLLNRNFQLFQKNYSQDADFCFIIGWMINVAFWYFETLSSEEYGFDLLIKAYKLNPNNSLFKWAVRNKYDLKDAEVIYLKNEILAKFEQFFERL